MQTRNLALQFCQRTLSAREVPVASHILKLPRSLGSSDRSEIARFALKTVCGPHKPIAIPRCNCLPKFRHQSRRLFEKNLAQVLQELLISSDALEGFVSAPGFRPYRCRRRIGFHAVQACQSFLNVRKSHWLANIAIHASRDAAFAVALHGV